ncbi:3-isopropylmalate dehydratase large subunit [bacterium]|nr:3-isopropylmalate dehydratase large subunit [bacterium]
MAETLVKKIISSKIGKSVKTGEIVIMPVDRAFCQDGTGPLSIDGINSLGIGLKNPEKCYFFIDHAVPPPRAELANAHKKIRDFASKHKANCIMRGICHQMMVEEFSSPYDIIVGADSHTPTSGALGCFAAGFGSTDVASAMATGAVWLKVPESLGIELKGNLNKGVSPKDVIIDIIGKIGADGATYKVMEFFGEGLKNLSMDGRFTIANMTIEAGAKTGIFPADEVVMEYLKSRGRVSDYRELPASSADDYEDKFVEHMDKLVPMVSAPHQVDNVAGASELGNVKVDVVMIGTCTNGRFSDFEAAYEILKKADSIKTNLIIAPASNTVLKKLSESVMFKKFVDLGASIIPPGCGPCCGVHAGILADGATAFSTANRNFKGRMGNPESFVYLGSPWTAAATAITGKITDPREFL